MAYNEYNSEVLPRVILCIVVLVTIVWGGISVFGSAHAAHQSVIWPISSYTRLAYPKKGLDLFLDPDNKLYGSLSFENILLLVLFLNNL